MNKEIFYNEVRPLFGGSLSQSQVEEIEAILDYRENNDLIEDNRQFAYVLATIFHETDKKMAPIEEYGKGSKKPYGKKIKFNKQPYLKPDKIYYGRGHTQNTWYENYEMLTIRAKRQGKDWDFLNNPELLLQREPSIWATFEAMSSGLYTGRKLRDYFNDRLTDWVSARRIINLLDKADLIAGYAKEFYNALEKSKL